MSAEFNWDQYRQWLGKDFPDPSSPAPAPWNIERDTRQIQPGQWYLPIVGENFDGHDFVKSALEGGSSGFFYHSDRKETLSAALSVDQMHLGVPVTNSIEALQKIALGYRHTLPTKFVAITGSAGKTTTKELLKCILEQYGSTYAAEGSFNNEIGVPLTICQAKAEHKFCILEFGARHPHDIKVLMDIAHPNLGCLLNVGRAHLGIFGSIEALLQTKMEILTASRDDALIVYPADDQRIVSGAEDLKRKKFTFGFNDSASICILDVQKHGAGMKIALSVLGQELVVQTRLAHESLPINVAACVAIATALGRSSEKIQEGISRFSGIPGRYKVHQLLDKTILVDDSYNANLASMEAGLTSFGSSFANRQTVLILGDIYELGDASEQDHRRVGEIVMETVKPSRLITVGQDAHWILEEAKKQGLEASCSTHYDDTNSLLKDYEKIRQQGEAFFIKASNGVGLGKVVDKFLEELP